MKFSIIYLLAIVGINFGFERLPVLVLPNGDVWPPLSLVVGIIFILRDYAQREIGHGVLGVMALGAALSYTLASPVVAMASLLAYVSSELIDWAVYSFSKWPFARRVWVSSAVSAPVDSAVFLWALHVPSVSAVLIMTVSKLLGIALVLSVHMRGERG